MRDEYEEMQQKINKHSNLNARSDGFIIIQQHNNNAVISTLGEIQV